MMTDRPTAGQPPSVAVIIPTHGRPGLVQRAVSSALAQTERDIEVIVVLDGPDQATASALAVIPDPRLRIESLAEPRGVAAARNRGVAMARAPWVALLDDDDEWSPVKLERQLATAEASRYTSPIVATHFLARFEWHEYVWPRRLPRPGEPLSEYLCCRSGPFYGEGVLLPSTLLARRSLFEQVPFSTGARRVEDVDWLLRAAARPDTGIEFVPGGEPLVVWNQRERRQSIAWGQDKPDWRSLLTWLDSSRPVLTRRAYSSALLTWFGNGPASLGEREAFWPYLRAALRYGQPTLPQVLHYLGIWMLPVPFKARLSAWHDRLRKQSA